MCAFGAEWQKETTLMYTAGLDAWFDSINQRTCEHATHSKVAGGQKSSDGWNSNAAAAYPPDFNSFVAQAFAGFIRQRGPEANITTATDVLPRVPLELPAATASTGGAAAPVPLAIASIDEPPIPSKFASTDAPGRKLNFDDHELGNIHEEPEPEDLPDALDQPADFIPAKKPSKPKVTFEKTAGARATRSNNPTVIRGLSTSTGFAPTVIRGSSTSTGFAMLSLGMTLSAAVYAMGTVDMLDELTKPDGSLSAALAKPSTIDPKSQADAYNQDKPGWTTSEAKELKNHADNGSWE